MIRILTYKEHPRGDAILDCYLYLAAYVLPFDPEDVLDGRVLHVRGITIAPEDFLKKSGKRARMRTKKYLKLLKKYHIAGPADSKEERLAQDRLLAAKLIWKASPELYWYLYTAGGGPAVRRGNLRTLLTVKMDELPQALRMIGAIQKKESVQKLLNEVFRYKDFSSNPLAAKLLEYMDVNVCPYCNRLYTVTLTEGEGTSRPQFDHYKSQSKYPYFAVSLMNLIPSCGLCNQSKGDRDEEVLYPYSDQMGTRVVFRTRPEKSLRYLTGCQDTQEEFSVTLDTVDGGLPEKLRDRVEASKDLFQLVPLYNKHKDYILYLFWKNYVFSIEYLQTLCSMFPDAFHTLQDVKTMMYLMDIDQAQWGRRPLGKLTHDIDMEIKGLTEEKS